MFVDPASGFGFYLDSALTIPLAGPLQITQQATGETGPIDNLVYFGSQQTDKMLEAASSPGTAQITLSVADSAPSSGHLASEVKLATTAAGLSSAVGGASLSLGTVLRGGIANVKSIYIRVNDSTGIVGFASELSVITNSLVVAPVPVVLPSTATLAQVTGNTTAAGSGTVTGFAGSLARTLGNTSSNVRGLVAPRMGTSAQTLQNTTSAVTATVTGSIGTLAKTNGNTTSAGVGLRAHKLGTLAITLANTTISASGTVT